MRVPSILLAGFVFLLGCAPPAPVGAGRPHDDDDDGEGEGEGGEGEGEPQGEGEGEPVGEGEGEGEGGAPFVLNPGLEPDSLVPDCYSNLSNEEFNNEVSDVFAFGSFNEVDLYSDCFEETSEGQFHVGLGSDGAETDAIALALSEPLRAGVVYELRFFGSHGDTGAATSSEIEIGVSTSPTSFGTHVATTTLLPSDPTELSFAFEGVVGSFITLRLVIDGDLGWAMIDDVNLQ